MGTHDSDAAGEGRDWAQPPRIDQELYEGYPTNVKVEHGFDPVDGMPRPVAPASVKLAQAPLLLPETFVCMADTSKFVVRDMDGEITRTFEPSEVERAPNGRYRVRTGWLTSLLLTKWTEVEPIRPVCKHYARQLSDVQDDPDFRFVARLCTLRRAEDGEFLSVRDSQVFACELRSPRDLNGSTKQLDDFDDNQIAENRKKQAAKEEAAFDVEAALAAEGDGETSE
jgi:hypothetical protein